MVEVMIITLGIVFLLVLLGIALAIAAGIFAMATGAVVWSRIAFGLLIGFGLSNNYNIVPGGGFWNFLVWAVIMLGAIFLLSALPRVDYALKCFCTAFMCYLAVEVVGMMCVGMLCAMAGQEFKITLVYEIVVKVLCVLATVGFTVREMQKGPGKMCIHSTNPILGVVQKILSSLIYGGTVTFLCTTSTNSALVLPENVGWYIFIGTTVVAFLAELFIIDNLVGQA